MPDVLDYRRAGFSSRFGHGAAIGRGASYQHIDSLDAARGVGMSPSSLTDTRDAESSGVSVTGHTSGQFCGDDATFGACAHAATANVTRRVTAKRRRVLVVCVILAPGQWAHGDRARVSPMDEYDEPDVMGRSDASSERPITM